MKKLILVSLALLLAAGADAQQKKGAAKKSIAKKNTAAPYSDNAFILNAINNDMMEIELANYAEKFADDQRVKDFAATVVRDHTRTKTELLSIARDKDLTAPDAMDGKHKAQADAMEQKNGTAFDGAYIDMMIKEHQKNIAEFKKAQMLTKDNHLKEFTRKGITILQTHLDAAKALQH